MAEIVENAKWTSSRKYPWDEWFDGQTRLLRRGEDFELNTDTFRANMTGAAVRRRLRLRTNKIDADTLMIQVTGNT